jgi:hypothetical protein
VSLTTTTGRSSTRLLFIFLAAFALVMSLVVSVRPTLGGETGDQGTIAIFKTMCDSIGQQDTCNGRDSSLDGYHIDYTVTDTETDQLVQTIVLTLGENAGGGGNTGGGSQGRIESEPLDVGEYEVCEAPDGAPIAYLEGEDDVPLDALPRPESGNGGSTGGGQTQDGDCIIVTITTGTSELKFLNQQLEPEGTGSIEILKTDDGGEEAAPLAGAEFTVEGVEGTFTTGADGTFCVDGLELEDTITVTETKAPAGHSLANPASQEVPVTVEGMCNERGDNGPDATFVNPAIPLVPTLVIDKTADATVITITDDEAEPSIVTWTLTYTLTNGPVHDAVITDEVPAGFEFLDAANGGVFADGTVTWTFAELTSSGSVSFRTTVDVDEISRSAPTVNTAVIDSNETEPDDGEDSVTVTTEDTAGGNPTPSQPDVPDTAMGGAVVELPAAALSLALLGALGAMLTIRLARRR